MYSPSLAFSVDAFVLMLHHKLLHPSWASYWHSHTNIGQVTMFSTMGNLNEGVAGGQDQNHTHKTGMCSAPSVLCPSRGTMRDVHKDNTTKSTYDLVGQGSRCAEC